MLFFQLAAVLGLLLSAFCFSFHGGSKKAAAPITFSLFALALTVRLLSAGLSGGFDNDTACFAAWADRIFQVGPGRFYSTEVFTDYPPGYMYLLYPIGALRSLFRIDYYSPAHLVLLRLPAIFCDLVLGCLLYREAGKRFPQGKSLLLCAAYLFNPAVILNSSVWGQVDSVYTLLLVILCLALSRQRTLTAYLSFLMGVLIKPQMLVFAPVLLAGISDCLFRDGFSAKRLLQEILKGLASLLAVLALVLPFGLANVLSQYLSTLESYPYAAVNACNFWGLLGLNWVSQDNTFLGLPYRFYGWAAVLAAVLLTLVISFRRRGDGEKLPLLAAFLMTSVFLFSVRMHERYLYPVLALLLLAYIYLPTKALALCYSGFSLLHFYNTAYVLFLYDPSAYDRRSPLMLTVSGGMLCCAALLYCQVFVYTKAPGKTGPGTLFSTESVPGAQKASSRAAETFLSPLPPKPSAEMKPLKKAEWLCMLLIAALYSCFALYDLGDSHAPSTAFSMSRQESIVLDFGSISPAKLACYIAPGEDRIFLLEEREPENESWLYVGEIIMGNVFTWQETDIPAEGSLLRLTLLNDSASLLELVFLDEDGNILSPANAADYPGLFDEQALYPERISFRNSMYFDEIYHARTAYEFLEGLTAYENTHPPLGKLLISAGIAVFGMNPFGWRIMGTLFGIAMLPLIYLFARKITEHTSLAALAELLFAFDFMHFTQTRIATIDVYIVFFVLLMYLFMYHYTSLSFYDVPLWKTFLPLGACGLCMGLGIACKWTGVYAGAGLAVIFFGCLFRRYREYRFAKLSPDVSTDGISSSRILKVFKPCVLYTLLFCILFFIILPALIYLAAYIPFSDGTGDGLFLRMLHNQENMLRYHSGLDATHPYSSLWYEWPVMKRPVWYYSGVLSGSLREGVSAFGNPLVWWAGIPAAFYMLYLLARKKDKTAAFLLTGYLAQYLPWFFVTRVTFIYHYFPSVVFVVLMIVYSMAHWKKRLSNRLFLSLTALYGLAALGLFLLFYPVLSGQPVDSDFVSRFLRWFDTWVLVSR